MLQDNDGELYHSCIYINNKINIAHQNICFGKALNNLSIYFLITIICVIWYKNDIKNFNLNYLIIDSDIDMSRTKYYFKIIKSINIFVTVFYVVKRVKINGLKST